MISIFVVVLSLGKCRMPSLLLAAHDNRIGGSGVFEYIESCGDDMPDVVW